ncbi:UDP-N-acetylmuramoyl-L-alanyl-D-glutamate--2,6-diaminopimelate ligase [Balneatrix alpica]|uniref:UDP-N-acetylmuramoyl-L-alanyl-D-glutamate--2, 6-diaminopimelate ligase n=1 Tax=Balneatrix alpica TaxID=75684 RepID=UPI0027382A19|nr:UDP-N-acetylmuramoyl-L-alanyl-D-glutamate--2,6-diaminopimelate ligase [Balneatrix alpica]
MTQPQTLGQWITDAALPEGWQQRPVRPLRLDSRQVQTGDWFVLEQPQHPQRQAFVRQALERGAELIISAEPVADCAVEQQLVIAGLASRLGEYLARYHGEPATCMDVIGVTGTNGKTSVTQFIARALESLAKPCALMGTLGYGRVGQLDEATHTTPDVLRVHQYLQRFQQQGCQALAMEVSSHALVQGRVAGVRFRTAVFTNLTRDHLDFHGTMEAYAAAKQRLFTWPDLAEAVVNLDDPYGRQILQQLPAGVRPLSYSWGQPEADFHVLEWQPHAQGMALRLYTPLGELALESVLLGRFNVSNLMAVVAVLYAQGFTLSQIAQAVNNLPRVNGRMESLVVPERPLVVVDYAHTPDALVQALTALRDHVQGRLWCVFGCGGDRDRGKRPLMAEAVEAHADQLVLTQDNPRFEDPEQIISDTLAGFRHPERVQIITDRAKAIASAIAQADRTDIILIAGKGHETYQDIAGVKHHFSDLDVARHYLELAP